MKAFVSTFDIRPQSLPPSTLGYWVKLYKAGKLGDVGKSYRPLTDVEMELARTIPFV